MALPYSYTPDVPQAQQQINNTQQPINYNFQDIATLLGINHVAFNTVDTFGTHNTVSYIQQTSDPSTTSTEMALYSKAVTSDPNILEMFYRYPSNGNIVQLTGNQYNTQDVTINTGGGAFTLNNFDLPNSGYGYVTQGYWQYLSNNILITSGLVSNFFGSTSPTSPYNVIFPGGYTNTNPGAIAIPSYTQTPFCILLTAGSAGEYSATDLNLAITATNNLQAQMYYNGSFASAPSTSTSVYITIIGI